MDIKLGDILFLKSNETLELIVEEIKENSIKVSFVDKLNRIRFSEHNPNSFKEKTNYITPKQDIIDDYDPDINV